ncbi:MAG TPA: hypothetical protein VLB86_00220 [Gaiellaceae bacterium]|nr:hypothetical protein [Gaiellaceae bacterium]
MGRRDELEPRFGWLATVGAALGILLLLVILAVVALDPGDEPPRTAAVQQWLHDAEHRRLAGLEDDVSVVDCEDTGSRLAAIDPVAVYRCTLAGGGSACFAVDGDRVVAAGRQLETTRGCEP